MNREKSALVLSLLAHFWIVGAASGCAAWDKYAKSAGIDLAQCAIGTVPQEVENLIPAVTAVLQGNSPNWASQLTALEALGVSAVACTVNKVITQTRAMLPPPNQHAEVDYKLTKALDRGKQYLVSKGITP